MSGTTFPDYQGGQQYGGDRNENTQQYEQRKPDYQQGNSGGGASWQGKKQWGGGGGGGAGGWGNNGGKSGGNWQGKKPFERPKETDMSFYKPYAVAGNQNFPPEVKEQLERIARYLEKAGYTMRCGGMEGFEEIAEKATTKNEIHLPWREFANKQSKFTYTTDRAMAVAKKFFPAFDGLKPAAQKFLAKNVRVMMGNDVKSPALFLLCWTEDGVESVKDKTARTGFTGHPIAIASALGIPIFNLGKQDAEQRLTFYIESIPNDEIKESEKPNEYR